MEWIVIQGVGALTDQESTQFKLQCGEAGGYWSCVSYRGQGRNRHMVQVSHVTLLELNVDYIDEKMLLASGVGINTQVVDFEGLMPEKHLVLSVDVGRFSV